MKRQSDEEWLAKARQRFAAEGMDFDIAPDYDSPPNPLPEPPTAACPTCDGNPALERLPHRAGPSPVPVQVCARCYGIWAPAGSLAGSPSPDPEAHPALRAAKAPPRCRECFGVYMPDGACAKCKKPAPPIACPACRVPMDRAPHGKERLEHCAACGGTWFETGEFPAIYGSAPRKSLLQVAAEQQAAENRTVMGAMLGVPVGMSEHRDGSTNWGALALHALFAFLRIRF